MKEVWDYIEPKARKHGLIKWNKWIVSGGGHIHIDFQGPANSQKLMVDFFSRPYLGWAFNDVSCTNWAANPLGLIYDEFEVGNCQKVLEFCNKSYKRPNEIALNSFPQTKRLGMRATRCTLEFRIFRAAEDWDEQVSHLDFVQAYVAWVLSRPHPGKLSLDLSKPLSAQFTAESSKAQFKELIESLGLDYARYKICEDFIDARFEFGPEYLT